MCVRVGEKPIKPPLDLPLTGDTLVTEPDDDKKTSPMTRESVCHWHIMDGGLRDLRFAR